MQQDHIHGPFETEAVDHTTQAWPRQLLVVTTKISFADESFDSTHDTLTTEKSCERPLHLQTDEGRHAPTTKNPAEHSHIALF